MNYFPYLLIITLYFSTHTNKAIAPNRSRGTSEIIIQQPDINVTVTPGNPTNTSTGNQNNDDTPESSTIDSFIDAKAINSTGIEITDQGQTIRLSEGINYDETGTVITLNAPNITLDLDGRRIRYAGPRDTGEIVHAITLGPSVKTAIIKNGVIAGFTGAAIWGVSPSDNLTVNVSVKNILVANCHQSIYFENIANTRITNTRIYNNRPPAGDAYGIKIVSGNDIRIDNCTVLNMTSADGFSHGFLFNNCKNCLIKSSFAINGSGATGASGFCIDNSPHLNIFRDNKSFSNKSSLGDSYGFYSENSCETLFENNEAMNNTTSSTTHKSYGFFFSNSHDISVMNNTATRSDYGFCDEESGGNSSNLFVGNKSVKNNDTSFLRPHGSPINFIDVNSDFLQKGLSVSPLDNVGINSK